MIDVLKCFDTFVVRTMNRLLPTSLSVLLSFSIIAFFDACTSRANQSEPVTTAAIAAAPDIPADVHIVAPGAVKQLIEIAGTLAANQEVSITSERTGERRT